MDGWIGAFVLFTVIFGINIGFFFGMQYEANRDARDRIKARDDMEKRVKARKPSKKSISEI